MVSRTLLEMCYLISVIPRLQSGNCPCFVGLLTFFLIFIFKKNLVAQKLGFKENIYVT